MRPIHIKTILLIVAVTFATLVHSTHAQVVISEFMAKNDNTLDDGDGNSSDWIELYNTGSSAVDLTGWYLSDNTNNLVKWTFPSTSIAAGEHLLVFASDQETTNYTDSLGYLHTTFKLSGDGESVVLTQADGVTIEHAFINYPDQIEDVSYGLAQDSSYHSLIVEEQDAKAFIGTYEPASTWNTAGFSDSAWLSGQLGVGFEEEDASSGGGAPPGGGVPPGGETSSSSSSVYADLINLDVASMSGSTDSAYIRVAFTLEGTEDISVLAMRMRYDDGFVAYINGTQVASDNAPESPTYASSATSGHGGYNYDDFTVLNAGSLLQTGNNVLAIHGLNVAGDTSDFFISPLLTGISAGSLQTDAEMYFSTATPGGDNVSGILGYVADTTFSVDRGFYTNAFDVVIGCDTENASIYYTTDGTKPAPGNGTLYTAPVTISRTTVLRAAAYFTGYQPSDIDTQTYIFLDDVIAQGTDVSSLDPYFPPSAVNSQGFDYGMDTDVTQSGTYSSQIEGALLAIPTISMVTDPENLFNATTGIYVNAANEGEAWERATSIELINPDGTKGFQINAGMRIRGESSTSSDNPKHSFRFIFDSEYGTSRLNYKLFGDDGADSFKRMDLRTGQNFSWANQTPQYATWLYDIFTRDAHRDMNQPYTRGEYYHLYINGMYWGLYQTEERCDSRFAESYYGDDNDDFDAVKADGDTGDMYAVDGTRDAYDSLWSGVYAGVSGNAAYFSLQGMNADGTENSSYTKLLDVDNVIDYMLLIYFTANRDSPVGPPMNDPTMPRNLNAIYNRLNPDGFKFVAHDNEHSLEIQEGVNHNRFNTTLSSSFDAMDFFNPWSMHLKLMANDEYALRFADHVHEHFFNEGLLTPTVNANRMEVRKGEIYAAVVAESARWGDSTGTLYTRDSNWLTWADWLTDTYMAQRTDIVYNQIVAQGWYPSVAAPEFNQHGGSISSGFGLSISGSGTIYYTTDGSDPRAVGGTVSGTAYSSAITLDKSMQVKARVLSGGTWSALTKATFVVNETSPLRVTEIMYHPAAAVSGAATNYGKADFEFIELLNTGTETIGLAGTEFSEGIHFDFTDGDVATLAPGEYAILASNLDAFKERYSNWASINIAGTYHGKFFIPTGSLDNGGEAVSLEDGLGNTILSFEYNDWYDITDGDGYSLTLIDPTAGTNTWSESSSWRPSKYYGGTPGEEPEDFMNPDDLLINEALTHQDDDTPGDWIELYNASSDTLNINGWFISDDEDNLTKVELSGLSTIVPGGYLVLTEASHFGLTAAGANGFALSELGDEIYLSSGEGGELTGYRAAQSFGAIDRDITFGRHVKSDGDVDFTAQSAQTYGAANAYPLISDAVFTEIMYHPADTNGFEFVEIHNPGSSSVALYHSGYPTNTWKLDGAVEFTFPEGIVLGAGDYLLITETDEATFRSYYAVDAGVTVLGPYDGKLNNGGEDLLLTRPGDPEELTGEIPYIVAEWVDYNDDSPWATNAGGYGASLERTGTSLYPNDYAHWAENAVPTPGAGDSSGPIAVSGITLSSESSAVQEGNTEQLTATVSPANATDKSVTWNSLSPSIATVNSSGLVTGVAEGTALIIVTTTDGGFSATNTMMVSSGSVASVTVSPGSGVIAPATTIQLSSTVLPADAVDTSVSWSSLNPSVATVNSSGLVTGVATGTASIVVTATDGGLTDVATITVSDGTGGTSLTIEAEDYSDKSTEVQTYTTGDITAINYVQSGSYVEYEVTIAEAGIYKIDYHTGTPLDGGTVQLQLNGVSQVTDTVPNNGSWDTFVPFQAGAVVSLSAGTHTIRLTAGSNAWQWNMDYFVLTRIDGESTDPIAVTGVSVSPTTSSIDEGATAQLTATVVPSNADNPSVTWSSLNPSVATVDSSGLVSGVSAGTASIVVITADGGYKATNITTVAALPIAVTGVSISPATSSIDEGDTVQLTATVVPSNADNPSVTWSSLNSSVATVDSSGLVSGVAEGTASIVVTTVDGGYKATNTTTITAVVIPPETDGPVLDISIDGDDVSISITNGTTDAYFSLLASDNLISNTWTVVASNLTFDAVGDAIISSTLGTSDQVFFKVEEGESTVISPAPTELTIEAESYDSTGGSGTYVNYSAYGGDDAVGVMSYTTGGGVGGINFVQLDDYAEYLDIEVAEGVYQIEYFIGTTVTDSQISLQIDGTTVASDSVANSGDWDTFVSLISGTQVEITAGAHTLRIVGTGASEWQWNMDYFILTRVGDLP